MADEQTNEQPKVAGSNIDPEKVPGGEIKDVKEEPKKDEKPTVEAELAKLRAENEEMRGLVKGATKRAGDAEAFVQQLTGKLSEVAERRSVADSRLTETPEEIRDRLRERMNEDPMSVLDEHYRARTAPLVQGFLEQQGRTNRDLFVARMSGTEEGKEVLKEYLEEVDGFLKDFPPENRAAPDAYDAALRWTMAKPENLKKEVQRQIRKEREKEKTHFVEPGTAGERAPKQTLRELSQVEKEVAAGLGISHEDYLKYKEA